MLSFFNSKIKAKKCDNMFITKAIINIIDNNFILKLTNDNENNELIDEINKRLEIYNNLYKDSNSNISILRNKLHKEEINKLNNIIEDYKDNINNIIKEKVKDNNKEVKNNLKLILELEKNKFKEKHYNELKKKEIEIVKLQQQLQYNNKINNYFTNKISTQEKGNMGEEYLYDYFKKLIDMSDGDICKVNGQSNSGDIYMSYKHMECCIESKNHQNPISNNELDRFLYTDIQNPRYNCGIFISIESGFCINSGIKHFEIKIENNKPCIFLCNIHENISDIKIAVKILNFILTIDYNIDKIEIINQIKKDLKTFKELEGLNNLNIKNLTKSCKIIKNKYDEIESLLDIRNYKTKKNCNLRKKRKINI